MINRIRAIRKQLGLTLAEVAEACDPPTTAQTIGRLETGNRRLSLGWMERIAAALGVEAETLVRGDARSEPELIAKLTEHGAEALAKPGHAVLPTELGGDAPLVVFAIEASAGEYRSGDQLWLRRMPTDQAASAINRDVLIPRKGGRFVFGRLIDRQGKLIGVLPPGIGHKQVVVDDPPWLAVAEMMVRPL